MSYSEPSIRAQTLLQLTESIKNLSDLYADDLISEKQFSFMFEVIYLEFNHIREAQKTNAESLDLCDNS